MSSIGWVDQLNLNIAKMPAKAKSPRIRQVVNEAIEVLQALGVPLGAASQRKREKDAMTFLAVAGVTHSADWPSAGKHPGPALGTRQIIAFINKHFGESISLGSYDDIRRKHLIGPVSAGIVLKSASNPGASNNDPRRGYALNPEFASVVQAFGTIGWANMVAKFMESRPVLADSGARRLVRAAPLVLPNGRELQLGPGEHNALQRAVIEQFRPRFAANSQVLYLGDADDRTIVEDKEALKKLGLVLDTSGSLPDIVLHDDSRGWIFLIEAVHSFGPISPSRLSVLETLCRSCSLPLVFVTAFLDRNSFRKFAPDIAWETEVWIAQEPDHMIHFNGDRFFGPRRAL